MKRIIIAATAILFFIARGFAQDKLPQIFTIDSFIQQVKKYHPLAKQADIQPEKAMAELLAAKGAFDPVAELDASRKTFDGKNYYYYKNAELTVPLPIGNIKTGIENNGGDYLLSEITKGKTSYLGVEIPLAKGLLLDKRRAALQQAQILRNQSEQERLVMLNNLLFEAYIAYLQWAASYEQYMAYSKFTEIAANRMRLVRTAFTNGERAMADTAEAFIQIQNYQLLQAEALLKMNNAKGDMTSFLWLDNFKPYYLPDDYMPDSLLFTNNSTIKNINELLALSALQNPALQIYTYKISSLEVERRLKFQNLLPYFSVKANLLNKDYYALKNISANFIDDNYKLGINFRSPLFFREARGDYKKAQLKIKETSLEMINKQYQTEIKIRNYFSEFQALFNQLQTANSMYKNYLLLLRTEELKYSQGESSLFFVNSREIKVIEIMQKKIELAFKCSKAKYSMEWAAGILQ